MTHFGQSLAEIEKLNDIVDSDSDEEERGTLSGKTRQLGSHCWFYCWYLYTICSVLSFNEKEYYVIGWDVKAIFDYFLTTLRRALWILADVKLELPTWQVSAYSGTCILSPLGRI